MAYYRKTWGKGTDSKSFRLTSPKKGYAYEEGALQSNFAKTLRDWMEKGVFLKTVPDLEYFEFSASRNISKTPTNEREELEAIRQGQRNKAKGYKAGWYDMQFIWKFKGKNPNFGFIEVKAPGAILSDKQEELKKNFMIHGVRHGEMWNFADGMRILLRWNLLPPEYHCLAN
jgi:hypothetical protein